MSKSLRTDFITLSEFVRKLSDGEYDEYELLYAGGY